MDMNALSINDPCVRSLLKGKGFSTDPMPSTDQMVVLFLREHDVQALPPRGTTAGDALSGAFFGAVGPAAAFGGAHLRNQEKIAAAQEWTTWKQWALSHKDWMGFKGELQKRYDENLDKCKVLLEENDFQGQCEAYKNVQRETMEKSRKRNRVIGISVVAALSVLYALDYCIDQNPQVLFWTDQSNSRPSD
ncbi:hypothetical protein [Synechococcus sp. 1G10]|uniref:hypothetical protein n=1 Tax=Synechococcus sp. 1G10 TaxID=2025605 RepID=UPI001E2DE337|nr:hypothetical protein [Synechococcus sp. 1G10]